MGIEYKIIPPIDTLVKGLLIDSAINTNSCVGDVGLLLPNIVWGVGRKGLGQGFDVLHLLQLRSVCGTVD